ncbi:MAG: pantoate--beta-alanine ligase, partial [Solirubrobacterales bacterium]
MRTIRTVAEMQQHSRDARADGRTIGLVPTMGAFHGGHESLMRAARAGSDELVVSLFVNPAQFNDPRDLEAYPRDEGRDAAIAERLGVDVLFAPPAAAVYPAGFTTTVTVPGLSDVLEGAKRGPGHFAGVSTVVAKLFNMVQADRAYFGQKDAQQVAVIKRMATDLNFRTQVIDCPTVREADG